MIDSRDIEKLRRETPGCENKIHLNNAGAGLMPSPVLNKMIEHLKLQVALGIGLGSIVLSYHFLERVFPGFSAPWSSFEPIRSLPYLLVLAAALFLIRLKKRCANKYIEFLTNSPGTTVDTKGITYGVGHGHDQPPSSND